MLVVVALGGLWSWRSPCRKTPAAGFPGRLLCCVPVFTVLQHPRCTGTLCARVRLPATVVSTDSLTRALLDSVGL